ncbi:hypothetical protein GWO43_22270 [candidate division KSB1 bacterium]|nr:hypothetical protein [candidate division KSB1 bacterium]NIR72626.1 hypothetical protein [candidate division KSB1 bacterium]NIS27337.1 hypothetical protein [candidate division KSB1 bacterium]NIT73550.1 hypothetical protein [candidate division KSB1 bacterium]NIU25398.1 hypothetical protein [candidate division KSB1 bacterium]
MRNLTEREISELIQKVFAPSADDRVLTILVDVPNESIPDAPRWKDRRSLASQWKSLLEKVEGDLGLPKINIVYFENTGSNNADLPKKFYEWSGSPQTAHFELLESQGDVKTQQEIFSASDIVLAPTEFSATAPLRILAKRYDFRAATMPGFSRKMIPALSVDYELVHERVMAIKTRLDEALAIEMRFATTETEYHLFVDVRYRTAHASSGLLRERGVAGNLPSGEAFIVPYEGEKSEPSKTEGSLPVQFGEEIVVYEIKDNRAFEVSSKGKKSESERQKLLDEPAYGNIAEIGFGVLQPFGIKPIGELLLDEKLGLHIAFGRSDHFGGAVGPEAFQNPKNVVHIDRIYIPEAQNEVRVEKVVFVYPGNRKELVIRDSEYEIQLEKQQTQNIIS